MYRNNPTLAAIEAEVGAEFEAAFGFSVGTELIHLIYGSQSLGVLHYMEKLQPVKMRGLLVFKPSERKLKQANVELPEQAPQTTKPYKRKKSSTVNHDQLLLAKFNLI